MASDKPAFRISFRKLAVMTVSLPLGAFFLCIIISYTFHFKRSTHTHCKVWNFAPSISSAIGVLKPQSYIWKLAIALHCAPRFLLAFMYKQKLTELSISDKLPKIDLSCWLNVIENMALLVLSFAPSKEDFRLHQGAFITFILCSQGYMFLSYHLWSKVKDKCDRGHTYKARTLKANLAFIVMSLYWYYRHNRYCEPGVYSLFSICEYGIVLTNIGFHFASYFDFEKHHLTVAS